MLLRVILVVDNTPLRNTIRKLLSDSEFIVETVRMGNHAWARASRKSGDVIIVSESLIPEPMEDSISMVQNLPELRSIIVVTESEEPEHQANLMSAGCDMVLYSGLSAESLAEVLEVVLAKLSHATLQSGPVRPRIAEPRLSDFVSESRTMQTFMHTVERVVHCDTSLLILGETGVGKERLAQAIHAEGSRSEGPFVAINCGALPEALLESELFGHEEGAFTGATRARRGAFEIAHNGSIFLDEIGELPLHMQVKLLRVLQDQRIRRVGGEDSFDVDVRIMAASNRDLEQEANEGKFRKDLFYRLSVVVLTIPPLRDRVEDIPLLVDDYIHHIGPRIGRTVSGIHPSAQDALVQYKWPGNVRELINVIERALLLCNGGEILPADLPESISSATSVSDKFVKIDQLVFNEENVPPRWLDRTLEDVRNQIVENVESSYLSAVLRLTGGRIGETADIAGIESRTLYDKMKKYGLKKEAFRNRKI